MVGILGKMENRVSYPRNRKSADRVRAPEGDISSDTPELYAIRLAGYISSPSTVRVRVLERFGYGPSLEKITSLMDRMPKPVVSLVVDEEDAPELPASSEAKARAELFDAPPWGIKTPRMLIDEVARSFGLSHAEIISPDRRVYIKNVRFLIATLMVERGNSNSAVATWMGRKDHSTIVNAVDKFPEIAKRNPAIARAYAHYRKEWGIG